MSKILEVRPLGGYRNRVRFSDGTQGEIDLGDFAGRGVFSAWADRDVFTPVRVDKTGGIEWPGEIDMCPDALYLRLSGKTAEDIFPGLGGRFPSDW
jgi:hypothetical protein